MRNSGDNFMRRLAASASGVFSEVRTFVKEHDTEAMIGGAILLGVIVASYIYFYSPWTGTNASAPMVLDVEMTNRKLAEDPLDHATRLELARYYLQWGLAVSRNELPDDLESDSDLASYFEKRLNEWESLGEDVSKMRGMLSADLDGFRKRFVTEERNLARGMFEQSVILFRQSRALGANITARDLYDLGTAYYQLGPEGYEGASKYLNEAVAKGLVSARALTFLGNVCVARGDFEDGITMYRRALDYAPDDPILAFNLALAYKERGQYAPAVEFLFATLRLYQDRENLVEEELSIILQARLALGWCLLKLSKPREAAEQLEALLEGQPELLEGHYWLGVAYESLGRLDMAKAHLQHAARITRGYRDTAERIASIERALQRAAPGRAPRNR